MNQGCSDFAVCHDGSLRLALGRNETIPAEVAVLLARWILNTFGDDEAPTP